jgi:hypothetical protein
MADRRPVLRVGPVTPEQARLARARAWEFILACHDEGRAAQHARDQQHPPATKEPHEHFTR